MAATCKNPTCDDRAWWGGWCRLCWQVTGVGEKEAAKRREAEEAEKREKIEADLERARNRLQELGDAGQLPWWEISEQLNAVGYRLEGKPFTPATARGAYLVLTDEEWG